MRGVTLENVDSVLCLGAHSDDIEIGCGGTLLELIAANPRLSVQWCVFSGGEVREPEARKSAERFLDNVDNKSVEIYDFRDSFFPDQWGRIKETIARMAKQLQPDLIFSHRLEDRHQDHRVIAELTWCAFRNHFILEYEIPKYEGDLGQPNFFCPLSEHVCEKKIVTVVECFQSQSDKPWFDAELFRSLMRLRGSECGSPSRYAEAFGCRKATMQVAR
jgi:LmbE family N-acetylglucosaminyl deacetylase